MNNTIRRDMKNMGDRAGRFARRAADDTHSLMNNVSHDVRHLYDVAADDVAYATRYVTKRIVDRPVQATLLGVAIGFLLGQFLRLRD